MKEALTIEVGITGITRLCAFMIPGHLFKSQDDRTFFFLLKVTAFIVFKFTGR